MKYEYLAGYIDGDGCIYCRIYTQKPGIKVYESSIQICSTDPYICQYFKNEFSGITNKKPEQKGNRKQSWIWYVKGKRCREILESVIPFLISKKQSSIVAVSLIKNIQETKCWVGKKVSGEVHNYRESLVNQIKEEIHMNDRVNEELFKSLKEIKKTKTPSIADFAYMAGLIDSEGCFRIQHWKSKREGRNEDWCICLEIGNTKFSIFPWLIERFGGNVVYRKPVTNRNNPMIIWCLRSDALYQILNSIYPYLRVKKERCEKLGQFHQTRIPNGGDRKSNEFKNRAMDLLVTRKKLFEEFQILNKKGIH